MAELENPKAWAQSLSLESYQCPVHLPTTGVLSAFYKVPDLWDRCHALSKIPSHCVQTLLDVKAQTSWDLLTSA